MLTASHIYAQSVSWSNGHLRSTSRWHSTLPYWSCLGERWRHRCRLGLVVHSQAPEFYFFRLQKTAGKVSERCVALERLRLQRRGSMSYRRRMEDWRARACSRRSWLLTTKLYRRRVEDRQPYPSTLTSTRRPFLYYHSFTFASNTLILIISGRSLAARDWKTPLQHKQG